MVFNLIDNLWAVLGNEVMVGDEEGIAGTTADDVAELVAMVKNKRKKKWWLLDLKIALIPWEQYMSKYIIEVLCIIHVTVKTTYIHMWH